MGLEISYGNDKPAQSLDEEKTEKPDLCVGCDEKKEEEKTDQTKPELKIDIIIDPVTGEIRYIIKEIPLE